jgi:formate dehydrogenase major subunit
MPTDYLEMHPKDATRLGFKEGDEVMLSSPRNAVKMTLQLTDDVRVGNLFTTFHFPDIGLNSVLSGSADNLTKCPEYKVQAVAILPA